MTISLNEAVSRIDVRAFYEAHGCIVSGKPTRSRREGLEFACSCPFCGGDDRASFWGTGRFCCVRGCQTHASSIYWYCRDLLQMTHSEALAELGIDVSEIDDSYSQPAPKLPLFLLSEEAPCKAWREAAAAFIRVCEHILWSSQGKAALNYLHSRGFKDNTIQQAHLGLCPGWHKAPLEEWGLNSIQLGKEDDPQIKIPKGVTIPWFVGGDIWKIQLRRPEPGPDGKHYKLVLGSSECLYTIRPIEAGQALLMAESELDALSAYQEAGDLVACIATGSAAKGSRHIGQIRQASLILQSFDTDEAGNKGAAEWLTQLPAQKARRWAPWGHDINDMLRTGLPVRLWVENGLQAAQTQPLPPALSVQKTLEQEPIVFTNSEEETARPNPVSWAWMPTNDRGLALFCSVCRQPASYWGNQGEPYCRHCCPWANTWPYNTTRKPAA